jgi:hypothetical protein
MLHYAAPVTCAVLVIVVGKSLEHLQSRRKPAVVAVR